MGCIPSAARNRRRCLIEAKGAGSPESSTRDGNALFAAGQWSSSSSPSPSSSLASEDSSIDYERKIRLRQKPRLLANTPLLVCDDASEKQNKKNPLTISEHHQQQQQQRGTSSPTTNMLASDADPNLIEPRARTKNSSPSSDRHHACQHPQRHHHHHKCRTSLGAKLFHLLIHGKRNRRICSAQTKSGIFEYDKQQSSTSAVSERIINTNKRKLDRQASASSKSEVRQSNESNSKSLKRAYSSSAENLNMPSGQSDKISGEEVAKSEATSKDNENDLGQSRNATTEHDRPEDEVLLFTSIQQLCYSILKEKLFQPLKSQQSAERKSKANLMCLFMFGRPGSNKGELAYELVEHSSLIDFILDNNTLEAILQFHKQSNNEPEQLDPHACPLYHLIDVASLIVANLDQRIREYNQLVAQTLRIKHHQAELNGQFNRSLEDGSQESQEQPKDEVEEEEEEEEEDGAEEGDEDEDDRTKVSSNDQRSNKLAAQVGQREPSLLSEISANSTSISQTAEQQTISQKNELVQFSLLTLSTKQRSILQMRLIRYKNCVTIKWILRLIDAEICRLEHLLSSKLTDLSKSIKYQLTSSQIAPRIYLINLVPNQLNLFKPCLFLQQSFEFVEFKKLFWGLKFERRTNIKVMLKEKAVKNTPDHQTSKSAGLRLPHNFIKFPTLGIKTDPTTITTTTQSINKASSAKDSVNTKGSSIVSGEHKVQDNATAAAAANMLTINVNEKLVPKYNESFAQQFELAGKLFKLRYNPIRNYNYANYSDFCTDDLHHYGHNPESMILKNNCHRQLEKSTDRVSSPGSISCSSNTSQSLMDVMISPTVDDDGDDDKHSKHQQETPSSSNNLIVTSKMCLSPAASSTSRYSFASTTTDSATSINANLFCSDANDKTPIEHHDSRLSLTKKQHVQIMSSCLVPKWAVELELVVGGNKSNSKLHAVNGDNQANEDDNNNDRCWLRTPTSAGANETHHHDSGSVKDKRHSSDTNNHPNEHHINDQASKLLNENVLHVFLAPASSNPSRPNSRTAFVFSTSTEKSKHQLNSYFLIQTKVAYANGKSHNVSEVKKFHHRTVKYKSRSDLTKLIKIITKARSVLSNDLESWLATSIAGHPTELQHRRQLASADQELPAHKDQMTKNCSERRLSASSHFNPLSLVTYTIKVELGRTNKHEQDLGETVCIVSASPKSFHRSSNQVKLLERPRASSSIGFESNDQLKRYSSDKDRPTSSIATSNDRGQTNRKHVRFCLNRAPDDKERQDGCSKHTSSHQAKGDLKKKPPQRRAWIHESLFVSCRSQIALNSMNELVEDIKSATKIN